MPGAKQEAAIRLQKEFFLARCASLHPILNEFVRKLMRCVALDAYAHEVKILGLEEKHPDKTGEEIKRITKGSIERNGLFRNIKQVVDSENPMDRLGIDHDCPGLKAAIYSVFSDQDRKERGPSALDPYERHGSLGAEDFQVFIELSESASAKAFDIIMTAISNAMCQYCGGILKSEYGPYVATDLQQDQRPYRFKKDSSLVPKKEGHKDRRTKAERLHFHQTAPKGMLNCALSGEERYGIRRSNYTEKLTEKNIPVLTGVSGLAINLFYYLSHFVKNEKELRLLQQVIVVYLLAHHDHAFSEVIDAINSMINLDIQQGNLLAGEIGISLKSFKLSLDNSEAYEVALDHVFSPFFSKEKTILHQSIEFLLKQSLTSPWLLKLIRQFSKKTAVSEAVMKQEVSCFLMDFQKIPPESLKSGFYEEVFRETDDNSYITPVEILVEMYLVGLYGSEKKCLTHPLDFEVKLIQSAGLAHTEDGCIYDPRNMPKRASSFPEKRGMGGVLSTNYYSPLVHMVWIFAGIQRAHSFGVRSENTIVDGFDWLGMSINMLTFFEYNSKNHTDFFKRNTSKEAAPASEKRFSSFCASLSR